MTSPDSPVAQLSDRESAVLRLLGQSHDAKSIARELGLSVHTVNEYLRAARRKLGVSSSREAARLFAAEESGPPKILVDRQIGVADVEPRGVMPSNESKGLFTGPQMALAVGGTLAMSLIAAATFFTLSTSAPALGPLPNWSTAKTVPSQEIVRNRVHLDGQMLTWNGSAVSEDRARQYLDITTQMSPQPLLVFSSSGGATEARKQWARKIIDEVLTCTPSSCLEIVEPAE